MTSRALKMAFDKRRYPPEWPAIRAQILQRAGNRCEGTPMHPDCRAENGKRHPVTGSVVVLTTAHLWDPDPMNCDEKNLRSLCQRCHLNWDRSHHLAKQKRRREEQKRKVQPELPEVT
jgi:hypothetical protein